jgi:hypothetical protein
MKNNTFFPNEKLACARPPAPTANPKQTRLDAKPSRDEVSKRAYYIYLKQGCPQGQDVQHWLEAEAQAVRV